MINKKHDLINELNSIPLDNRKVTVSEFVNRFSHNNTVWVENANIFPMSHRYRQDKEKINGTVMDWELKYTNIADCNVVRISNTENCSYMIIVDTDKTCFDYIPEKVLSSNAPLWLYNEVHGSNLNGSVQCCSMIRH
jgi:hypothetical protein